jgi:hypothetical protein
LRGEFQDVQHCIAVPDFGREQCGVGVGAAVELVDAILGDTMREHLRLIGFVPPRVQGFQDREVVRVAVASLPYVDVSPVMLAAEN